MFCYWAVAQECINFNEREVRHVMSYLIYHDADCIQAGYFFRDSS